MRTTPCFASYRTLKLLFQDFEKRKLHSASDVWETMSEKPFNPVLLLEALKIALLETSQLWYLDAQSQGEAPL
jgi:hypothetical protein